MWAQRYRKDIAHRVANVRRIALRRIEGDNGHIGQRRQAVGQQAQSEAVAGTWFAAKPPSLTARAQCASCAVALLASFRSIASWAGARSEVVVPQRLRDRLDREGGNFTQSVRVDVSESWGVVGGNKEAGSGPVGAYSAITGARMPVVSGGRSPRRLSNDVMTTRWRASGSSGVAWGEVRVPRRRRRISSGSDRAPKLAGVDHRHIESCADVPKNSAVECQLGEGMFHVKHLKIVFHVKRLRLLCRPRPWLCSRH